MSNYLNFPSAGIGTHESEKLIEWLEKYPEPDLWHQLVFCLNYDQTQTLDYVLWIVQQPQCDVATAVSALSLTYAYECIYSEDQLIDSRISNLAKIICSKSERGEYYRSKIGGVVGMLDTPSAMVLSKIDKGCAENLSENQQPFLPIPRKILNAKFPDEYVRTRYFVDESCVIRVDSLDERTRKILGYED